MGRRLASLVALALTGCGPSDVVLSPPPSFDASLSTLYVVERGDEAARLFAASADTARPFSLPLEGVARARVTALGYARDLAELGLAEGEVALITDGRCRSRPLPAQAALHTLTVDGGEAGGWIELDARPVVVQDLRVDGPCPCRALARVQTVDVDEPSIAYFGDLEGRRLSMVHRDGTFTWIDEAGGLQRVDTSTRAPVEGLSAITRAPDGTMWIANTDGELLRGRLGEAFEPTALVGNGDFIRSLAAGPGPAGNELYGVTDVGFVLALEPGPPRSIASPEALPEVSSQRARTLWLGPGEIVASLPTRLELVWLSGDVERARTLLPESSGGARFLTSVPGVGVVVLSHDARVLELDGFEALARSDAPELATPTGMLAFEGGYLYAGDTGYVQEFRADYGFCPTQYLEERQRVLGLASVGERVVFIVNGMGGGLQVLFYELRPLEGG